MTTSNGQPTHRTVKEWMQAIKNEEVALPRFQRGIVWKDQNICDLFTALLKSRPVGTLLVLGYEKQYEAFEPEPIMGAPEDFNIDKCKLMILDGQQRLTALWRALNDDFYGVQNKDKQKKFYLKLKKNINIYESGIEIETTECKKGNELKKIVDMNPQQLLIEGLIPVDLLFEDNGKDKNLRDWCIQAHKDNAELMAQLLDNMKSLAARFNQRDISYYELPEDVSISEAIDSFIKINTSASKMTDLDIAIASIEEKKLEKELKTDRKGRVKFRDQVAKLARDDRIQRFILINTADEDKNRKLQELIVKISCLLTEKIAPSGEDQPDADNSNKEKKYYPPAKQYYRYVADTVAHSWDDIVNGLNLTLNFLEGEDIFDGKRLPSEVPLRVLPALYASMIEPKKPDQSGELSHYLRAYLWRCFVTERYSRSANTLLCDDYTKMREEIHDQSSEYSIELSEANIFNERKYPLPDIVMLSDLKRKPLKSPKSTDRLARSIMVISLKNGAIDIATDDSIAKSSIGEREYHHLFPQKILRENNWQKDQINHALNFALISSESNNTIGAKKPKDYLQDRVNGQTNLTDVRKRIESHLIPYDKLNVEDGQSGRYETFIKARAELFVDAIKQLCDGKRYP